MEAARAARAVAWVETRLPRVETEHPANRATALASREPNAHSEALAAATTSLAITIRPNLAVRLVLQPLPVGTVYYPSLDPFVDRKRD